MGKELDDFINALPKVAAETATTDAEMDTLLGIKVSEVPQYSGPPGAQDWPASARIPEGAATTSDKKKKAPAGDKR